MVEFNHVKGKWDYLNLFGCLYPTKDERMLNFMLDTNRLHFGELERRDSIRPEMVEFVDSITDLANNSTPAVVRVNHLDVGPLSQVFPCVYRKSVDDASSNFKPTDWVGIQPTVKDKWELIVAPRVKKSSSGREVLSVVNWMEYRPSPTSADYYRFWATTKNQFPAPSKKIPNPSLRIEYLKSICQGEKAPYYERLFMNVDYVSHCGELVPKTTSMKAEVLPDGKTPEVCFVYEDGGLNNYPQHELLLTLDPSKPPTISTGITDEERAADLFENYHPTRPHVCPAGTIDAILDTYAALTNPFVGIEAKDIPVPKNLANFSGVQFVESDIKVTYFSEDN